MAYSHNGTAKQLISLTRGYGSVDRVTTQFAYTGSLLTGITIPMAQTWAIQYDSSNRIISITSPVSGTVGQAGYTPAYVMKVQYYSGSTVVTKGYGDSGVLTATYTLDGNGQATMVDDSWGHTTQATYNGDHQVASLTDGLGHTLTNVFGQYVGPNGSIGLVTETDAPPITPYYPGHAQQAPKITYRYDPTSYDLLERDTVDGASTRYSYDGHHRLLTTAELVSATTSGGTTTYHRRGTINTYGQYGELTAVKDGRGVSVPDTTSFAATPSVSKNAQLRLQPARGPDQQQHAADHHHTWEHHQHRAGDHSVRLWQRRGPDLGHFPEREHPVHRLRPAWPAELHHRRADRHPQLQRHPAHHHGL